MGRKRLTQITSWKDLQEKLRGRRKEVYEALRLEPMTLFELKQYLGWEINSVSGRVTELSDQGLIEESGTRKNQDRQNGRCLVR